VVERVLRNEQEVEKEPGQRRALSVQASLMTPVQPMLVSLTALPCPLSAVHVYPSYPSLRVRSDRECQELLQVDRRNLGKETGGAVEHCSMGK
jgi:hypothetical protein